MAAHLESCESCTAYLNRSFQDTVLENLAGIMESSGDFVVDQNARRPSRSFDELRSLFQEHSRYELIEQLGAGGMGAVYLASHSVMGRQVGIKVINDQFVSSPDAVGRFFQEVRTAESGTVSAFRNCRCCLRSPGELRTFPHRRDEKRRFAANRIALWVTPPYRSVAPFHRDRRQQRTIPPWPRGTRPRCRQEVDMKFY